MCASGPSLQVTHRLLVLRLAACAAEGGKVYSANGNNSFDVAVQVEARLGQSVPKVVGFGFEC